FVPTGYLAPVTTPDMGTGLQPIVSGQCEVRSVDLDPGIVDDLLVYRFAQDAYMLVVNASNIEKDWEWIQSHDKWGVEMENASENTVLLAVQGPKAIDTLQKLTDVKLSEQKFYTFKEDILAGKEVIISATGYTGAGGFELYVQKEDAEEIWNQIFEAGKPFDIQPIGLGARDTLRLEKGYCLYGNDIDDATSPLEAGLGWVTKFSKAFIHAENLKAQKEKGVEKKLVGFQMVDKGIPRNGYEIMDEHENIIGKVTSGTLSPSLNIGIGMGYVSKEHSSPNQDLFIKVRNKNLKANVTKPPFL
ncbi:MAG: glycine cleavage system aminomethyltransferase GcvT, partial [Bacteroidota bacterium]